MLGRCGRRLLVGVMSLSLGWGLEAGARDRLAEGLVMAVQDGDTIDVRLNGKNGIVRLRLLGVDAPEIAHGDAPGQEPWGSRALRFMKGRVLHQVVAVLPGPKPRDAYGRLLATVRCRGRSVNHDLVAVGLALADPHAVGPDAEALRLAQATAQAMGRGIWQRDGGLKERPADYRRRYRERRTENTFR